MAFSIITGRISWDFKIGPPVKRKDLRQ